MQSDIMPDDPLTNMLCEHMEEHGHSHFPPHRTLKDILSNGFKNAFTEECGCHDCTDLQRAFYFMYLRGFITSKTYNTFLPLFAKLQRWPWEYYEDGTIRFVDREDFVPLMDSYVGTYRDRYDPIKALIWVCEVLARDASIRNFLCMESYEDMMSSADGYELDVDFMLACLDMNDSSGESCLCGDKLFHFIEEGDRLNLYMNDKKIQSGMAGSVLYRNDDYYFKIDMVNSYLHINARNGIRELCQNIFIIGFNPEGDLVYEDYQSGKICRDDANGNTFVICECNADMRYDVGEYILATSALEILPIPHRITYEGQLQEAFPEDRAVVFWNYFIHNYSRKLAAPQTVEEALLAHEFQEMTRGTPLTLGCVMNAMNFVRSNKCWSFGPAFPLINSVKLLLKKGVNPEENIADELWSIVKYNELVNVKSTRQVTPVFYFTLYRLSKGDDFLTLLRDDPQQLFEDAIAASNEARKRYAEGFQPKAEGRPVPDAECCFPGNEIGVFRIEGNSVHAITVPVEWGIVRGDEVVFVGSEEQMANHPGRVFYDLQCGKFVILMQERSEELMAVIRRVFHHPPNEVEYRVAGDTVKEMSQCLPFD